MTVIQVAAIDRTSPFDWQKDHPKINGLVQTCSNSIALTMVAAVLH